MKSEAQKIIIGYDSLKSARSTFDQSLRDITYYVLPEYENANEDTTGDDVPDRPVSSAPTRLAIELGANIHSYTYRQGDENFSLRTVTDDDNYEAKDWLADATKKAIKALQNSNFTESYNEMCRLYPTYGTGCVSSSYDKERAELVFRNHSVSGNLYFIEDEKGNVCGAYRLLKYTASQAREKYSGLPEELIEAANNPSKISDRFDFIQMVVKNPKYNPRRKDWQSWKYRSVHVFRKEEIIVHEEGFRTFPFHVPRFIKMREFTYGYGCGHLALPAIRELNRVQADLPDAIEMAVHRPTMFGDEDSANEYASKPNHVGFADMTQGQPWQPDVDAKSANVLAEYIQTLYQELVSLFFSDVFLSISQRWDQEKTAREVDELSEEKLSTIAPIVSRLQSEFWSPMIERIVDLLIDAGVIEQPPESIAGKGFRVVYTSRIDTKLAAIEVNKTLQASSEAQRLIAMELETPTITDVIKIYDAAQDVLEKRNFNLDFVVRKSDREKLQKARDAAMARQEQSEAMQKMAGPVNLLKKPEPGSPLQKMEGAT